MKALQPRLLVFSLVLMLAALIGACSSIHINSVTVSIADIKPVSASVLQTEVLLTLRYSNENVIPLGLSGGVHKLSINGKYVGKAVSDVAVGLPPLKVVTDTVTLRLDNLALLQELIRAGNSRTASYKLDSRLFLVSGEEKTEIRSVYSDMIDLQAFSR